ncbi:MAG: hypothetical protein ABSD58_10115 [Verrucomicrobiia bacterium]|jgi:hypothetical protein
MRVLRLKGQQLGKGRVFVGVLVVVWLITANASDVCAVLFQSTGDPTYNTNAPSGPLTNSGWQYEGRWDTSLELSTNVHPMGSFLGTPIAPQFFITAAHIYGSTNDVFVFNGVTYHPVAQFTTLDSDLSIWQVAETFPYYAPLYTASGETNSPVVVFGRGTQSGEPVVVGGQTNGWLWVEPSDGVERWGESRVGSIINGGTGVGDLLRCAFDAGAGSNACDLSEGDSGGGLFIEDGGVWKLAGINYGVDGPFSNAVDGTEFDASLLDVRGLFEEVSPGNWQFMSGPQPIPSAFYSTRISANLDWIESVINFDLGPDLQIAGVQVDGNDAEISFDTGSNRVYYVQSTGDPANGPWSTIISNVAGTGGTVTVIDTNAVSSPPRYYRIGLSQ